MDQRRAFAGTAIAVLLLQPFAQALEVSDFAVRLGATVETLPPRSTLAWPADPGASDYQLYRKSRDATAWGTPVALPGTTADYLDADVSAGSAYEYRVSKNAPTYYGEGYIYAGLELPLVESRGKVVLLVDNLHTNSLAKELVRLQLDLVGDGWTVLRHDVARTDSVASVKARILSDYQADPSGVKAVFLFGHVPVPYSGRVAPDDHPDHVGAWPADAYYGDMDGVWTDSSVTITSGGDPRNHNVPGDGKFDQNLLPSDVEMQVGRVDLSNLPVFPEGEAELLRRYLNKDHRFRHKLISVERRGLIADNLGYYGGDSFAVVGWRNFAPFFGASNTIAGDWLGTLASQDFLWGYGCGGGSYSSAGGIATADQFATNDTRVVFTLFFGSYFGDWDTPNNFLRAQLGTATFTLTSAWAGRPYWQCHHMALGETIGFSARLTQNNRNLYDANSYARYVHIALMGDPTLRLHPVSPPSNLMVVSNSSGGLDLRWDASADPVAGYAVYRAPAPGGPYTRLNTDLVVGTGYAIAVRSSDTYMVRAVKLETSASGNYYNASQGVFGALRANAFGPVTISGEGHFSPNSEVGKRVALSKGLWA